MPVINLPTDYAVDKNYAASPDFQRWSFARGAEQAAMGNLTRYFAIPAAGIVGYGLCIYTAPALAVPVIMTGIVASGVGFIASLAAVDAEVSYQPSQLRFAEERRARLLLQQSNRSPSYRFGFMAMLATQAVAASVAFATTAYFEHDRLHGQALPQPIVAPQISYTPAPKL